MSYLTKTKEQLQALLATEKERFLAFKELGLRLDMSRGKPSYEQLDLSSGLLDMLNSQTKFSETNDYRNYGIGDGIPEIKKIFCDLLSVKPSEICVLGNSSLNIMYDTLMRAMQFGVLGGTPLTKQEKIKWLCPSPGYDRHFGITEQLGFELITVPMTSEGVDMNAVENLVKDETVKGMWCVPKYSNPQGIVYSDKTVERLASLKPKSKDFRIYWDNAYMVHGFNGDTALKDIFAEAKKHGNEDIFYMFGSTSKITYAGAGVAFFASSEKNINDAKAKMFYQTIGHDKLNQLAHALYFKNADGLKAHMARHALVLKPKFDAVLKVLNEELGELKIASWLAPNGGYFISVDLADGTAKRTLALAKEAGVIFTPAGATYPYGKDLKDSNVRIAPSMPKIDELITATKVFCCSAKIAVLETL
ncbi:MAG: aminotransferase class I/II-fold pyridoxal phosphate-dependent enzyme [Firmicutes bacterium]|nr:aminotransferase class I/II-fold pyridoxal phosphate-dependent enzyme [Bacillota bacterium]